MTYNIYCNAIIIIIITIIVKLITMHMNTYEL